MRRHLLALSVCGTAAVISLALGPRLLGQTVADQSTTEPATGTKTGTKNETAEEVVKMSPFLVEDTRGENSYRATSTLAGTRVRTDLNDVASAISVVTSQFLQDTGVKNNQDLLVYTPSTEVSGVGGNYSGFGGQKTYNESSKLINPSTNNRVRGLDAADNTRDYFLTDIPWDSFNVGRIDLQRGPNSILFGVGSPAGIINASINDATYRNSGKIEAVVDQYASLRGSADVNQVLLNRELALRVALLIDKEKYEQKPAFNNQKRVYASLRFDKELLGKGNNTTVRLKFEDGRVSSNNPRILPPNDLITPWFDSTYNKVTVNTGTVGNGYLSATSPAIALLRPGGVASLQGVSAGPDVKSYYTGGSSTPALIIAGSINTGPGMLVQAIRPLAMPTYSQYAAANLPGGSFYQDKVLTDSSVFDFYKNLLDGPNKHEWQSWRAENIDLQQTFFHDKLAFDFTYDRQDYTSGQTTMLTGGYYAIGVEVNQILEDGSTNPYLGRPYVASSDGLGNYSYNTLRQSKRGIATLDLKAEDYFGKNWLSYILGRSVFTGLANEDEKDYKFVQWAQHATTPDLINLFNLNTASYGSIAGTRQFDWIDYLGPSLLNASSAHGANLSPITVRLSPGSTSVVKYFNGTWKDPTVRQTDPYTYTDYNTSQAVVGTQVDNPVNYVGWTTGPVNWLSATNPADFPSLVIGGDRQNFRDISSGFTWQGYLLGGDLVPTFGWRKDKVINYDTTAQSNSATGIAPLDYALDPAGRREANGQSRNWSGVYHIPKKLMDKIWPGMSISLFYDESSNFKADAPRRNLMGNTIANPQGKTREKGFSIGLFNDKLIFKANWFQTRVSNATLASGASAILGTQSYELYQLMALGYVEAAMVQDNLYGLDAASGYWAATYAPGWVNYAYADGVAGVSNLDNLTNTTSASAFQQATQTTQSKSMVQAWLNMPSFITKDFYKFWNVPGTGIDPSKAKASGRLDDGFTGGGNTLNDFLYLVSILQPAASTLPVSTVDTRAKGQEFEITAAPAKNWNVSLNYVRTFATRTNLDSSTIFYMNAMNDFWKGDAGYMRLWGLAAYGGGYLWHKDLWLPYQVTLSSQGQSAPEVSKWRTNLVTTYNFDHGKLKGWMVGGAARLEAGRISGYRYSSALGYLDVHQPLMGPQDEHYDLWVGYSKKLSYHDFVWHVQLNLRNVGEKTRLVPAYFEPDGSLALARIQEGMGWRFTNSIEF